MRLNLSWRQKLNALMVATPIGFALMVGVVVWGLSTAKSPIPRGMTSLRFPTEQVIY